MRLLSDIRKNRSLQIWLGVTLFCLLFSVIYESCSFGVISWYMCGLFLIPLVMGVIPSLFFQNLGRLWNDGILCLIAGSALQGILEIYGTDSRYPVWFLYAGLILSVLGLVIKLSEKTSLAGNA